ncbi:hypothetical protein [Lutibaculum baratangense]|uniref:Uncharacterized protein n=1 Tax=Lutibaculum baratangense AMV1 TaxID=631454 RepID=V4R0G2_9HYPH|nr:hypothetical protein [Lutibaculum baratangense]ESR25467.1 hypothetical protein N177_1762 [Lutibaculum baratangense AMV1]
MAKVPTFAKAFAGRWRIVEMEAWDVAPRGRLIRIKAHKAQGFILKLRGPGHRATLRGCLS